QWRYESLSASKRTALFAMHKALGARLIPFSGWEMPVEYSGIAKEHTAVRTAAGLFDVSHMGEFEIRGREALNLIQFVTTNDARRLIDGQAQYSAMAYPHGTVVDDLLIYRHRADHFMLVVNAANIRKDFEWIASHNRCDATIDDISDDVTLLALQGPKAIEILQTLTNVRLSEIEYYHFVAGKVLDVDAILSRTGYTGEEGVKRRLVGFEMVGREIARDHYPVFLDGQEAGHVTSGAPSITLKKNIGLAYLPAERAAIGIRFHVLVRSKMSEAKAVRTPFYKRTGGSL